LRRAQELQGQVRIDAVFPSDVRPHEIKTLAHVEDDAQQGNYDVVVAVDRDLRIRFAQCSCPFFREYRMSCGPCEHILAAHRAAEAQLHEIAITREMFS
jgi:predicted nucleic acid-binding Zn finger protein